jgi:hypothetical protein
MNKGINLLTEKKIDKAGRLFQSLKVLRIIAVSLLFVVSLSSIILFILISFSPLPTLKQQEQERKIILSHFNSEIVKLHILNERLNTIDEIMSKRTSFDDKINLITSQIPSGVMLKSLTIEKNTINVILASNSLLSFDTFLNNVMNLSENKKESFRITINNLTQVERDSSFVLDITLLSYE